MTDAPLSLLFAWPTSGQRNSLGESTGSLFGNLARHGDSSPCLIAYDGSTRPDIAPVRSHRQLLISSRREREAFLETLNPEIDDDAARWALLGERPGRGAGTNRNAILLSGAGDIVVSTDDDILCAPAVLPGFRESAVPERTVSREQNPAPCRYFPDRTACVESVVPTEIDLAARYRSFFGPEPDAAGIILASPGSYGDSGFGSARGSLSLDNEQRTQLHGDGYERMRLSREITRIPVTDTVARGTGLMTMQAAFDVRIPLPPFFPVGRAEDSLFGLMLRIIYPESRTLFPAFGFLHDPPAPRPFDRRSLTGFSPCLAELVMALAVVCVPASGVTEPGQRFIAVAENLREIASLRMSDFVAVLHESWSGSAISFAENLESLMVKYERRPPAWAEDVDELLGNVYESAREPSRMFGKPGCGFSPEEVRSSVGLYARTLGIWPDLFTLALTHNREGHRVMASEIQTGI